MPQHCSPGSTTLGYLRDHPVLELIGLEAGASAFIPLPVPRLS